MLKTFDIQAKDKVTHNEPSKKLWIQLVNPNQSERKRITKDFLIPFSILDMHLSDKKMRTLVCHSNLFAFTVDLPFRNDTTAKIPFSVIKCSIVVINNTVITISEKDHPILKHLEEEYTNLIADAGVTGFVYRFFELANHYFSRAVIDIVEAVSEVERKLQVSITNKQVFDLLNNNKSYLYFTRALKSNGVLLKEVSNKRLFASDYKTDVQLIDIMIANQQICKKVEIYNSNLTNLMDAYSAAIENNLSLAVQYLTVFITIVSIPLAMAGIYGMNTPLPIQDEPYALSLLAGITFAVVAIFLVFFKARRFI